MTDVLADGADASVFLSCYRVPVGRHLVAGFLVRKGWDVEDDKVVWC